MPEDGSTSDRLLEQYKLLVLSAEQISARRSSANNYFLAVNGLLASVYSVAKEVYPGLNWNNAIPYVGVVICLSWWTLLRSYRNVNTAKFAVIQKLEKQLPVQPYANEWQLMSRWHIPLSHIEQWIPMIFGFIYAGVLFA